MTDKSISAIDSFKQSGLLADLNDIKDGFRFYCHLLKDWAGGTIIAFNIKDQSGFFLFSLHFEDEQQVILFWEHLWMQFNSIDVLNHSSLIDALAESTIKTQSGLVRDDVLNTLAHFM